MVVACPHCAAVLPSIARFCRRCGSPVRRRVTGPCAADAGAVDAVPAAASVRLPRQAGRVTVAADYIDLAGKAVVAVAAVASVTVVSRRNFSPADAVGSLAAGAALAFGGLWAAEHAGCVGVLMVLGGAFAGLKGIVAGLATREWFVLGVTTIGGQRHELACKNRRPLDRAAAAIAEAMTRG